MMSVWRYGGGEYPFDISEAGCMQRLTEALASIKENSEKSAADNMEAHCCMIAEFFDILFGEGAGVCICGSEMSAKAYSAAYLDFIAYLRAQIDSLSRLRTETEARYLQRGSGFPHE